MKRKLSTSAVARTLYATLEDKRPLSKTEADRISYALKTVSGVPDALDRIAASYMRLALSQVTDQ